MLRLTLIDQFDYTYDHAGNRLTRNVTGASTLNQTYTYDSLRRLQTVDEDSGSTANDRFWDLDQLGNWSEMTCPHGRYHCLS